MTIHKSNSCHAWTIHESNLEQLLVCKAPREDNLQIQSGTAPPPLTGGYSLMMTLIFGPEIPNHGTMGIVCTVFSGLQKVSSPPSIVLLRHSNDRETDTFTLLSVFKQACCAGCRRRPFSMKLQQ